MIASTAQISNPAATMAVTVVATGGGGRPDAVVPEGAVPGAVTTSEPSRSFTCLVWGLLNKMQIRFYGCEVPGATFKSGLLCEFFLMTNGWSDIQTRKMQGSLPGRHFAGLPHVAALGSDAGQRLPLGRPWTSVPRTWIWLLALPLPGSVDRGTLVNLSETPASPINWS